MRKVISFVLAAIVLNNAMAFSQDGEIAEAKRRAEAFSLLCEFAFPEYRMVAEITAEALPGSDYLFKSKATMEILQTKEFRVEKTSIDPKLIADNRLVKSESPGGIIYAGPFTRFEKHEWLIVDGNTYDLEGRIIEPWNQYSRRRPFSLSEPIDEWIHLEIANIQPFDWPLVSHSAFDRKWKDRDMYKYTFGKDILCVFASSASGLLESHWLKPSNKVAGVDKITFENDLVVSKQIYIYGKPIYINNIDLKAGWLHTDTHIIWEKKGESSYPKTVVSTMRPEFRKPNSILLEANITLTCPGDTEFDLRREEVQKKFDMARAAKQASDSQKEGK